MRATSSSVIQSTPRVHGTKPSLAAVASTTPATRDRYVDFLRAFSIGVVVFGHWLMAIVEVDGARVSQVNALAVIPMLWLATWFLQVMPLFFFVGGFSNSIAVRANALSGGRYSDFLKRRVDRLMRPTIVFAGVWLMIAAFLKLVMGIDNEALRVASTTVARPVWFLGVYLMVVMLAPAMLRAHERVGLRAVAALGAAALAVDVIRFATGVDAVGYVNFAFVWLFAHQLGFFYADGTFAHSRRRQLAVAAGGLAALGVLTNIGVYSPSMVGGLPGDLVSNNHPPTICIVALAALLVGVAISVRAPMSRWLARRGPWKGVVTVNSMIMSIYLWHLTALAAGVVAIHAAGLPQPGAGTAAWWLWRPVWMAFLCVLLAGLVAVFRRFESFEPILPAGRMRSAAALQGTAASVAGMILLIVATSGFALFGFYPSAVASWMGIAMHPWALTAELAAGMALLRRS